MIWITCSLPPTADAQTLGGVHNFHRISDGVIVAEPRYGGGNSTIVINSDHIIVIDSQGSEAAAVALIGEIRRLTGFPVRYVVNSHWHGDHHGGNQAFRAAFPDVEIIAHPKTAEGIRAFADVEIHGVAPFLRNEVRRAEADLSAGARAGEPLSGAALGQLTRFVESEVDFLENVPPDFRYTLPDRFVEDVLVLRDGGRVVRITHPGAAHTEGDLMVHLPDEGILVAGDLVTVPYIVPRSGYPQGYAQVLRGIASGAASVVVPGHGLPGDHRELASLMAGFLEDVTALALAAIEDGMDLDSAITAASGDATLLAYEALIDWDAEGGMRFLDFQTLLRMSVQRAYVEAGAVGG